MFNTFEQCLDVYKKELERYSTWVDDIKREITENNNIVIGEVTITMLDETNRMKEKEWNQLLDGMKKVLNISDEEVTKIFKEFNKESLHLA